MPDIDVIDSTWICARPRQVAAVVAEPANWRRWWPKLRLDVEEWRGNKGVRWTVQAPELAAAGTMEIWLEPAFDGVVVHYFLRLDGVGDRPIGARRAAAAADAARRGVKQTFWALGDQLDPGRTARVAAPNPR